MYLLGAQGLLNLPSAPIVAYDSTGVIFAVGLNIYSRISLYDTANYDKEPFLTVHLDDPTLSRISFPPRPLPMTSLEFATNGSWLLVGTAGHAHYILDAFDGGLLAKLEGHKGLDPKTPLGTVTTRRMSGEEVCFTPDSKFVLSGSEDGKIYMWDLTAQDLTKMVVGRDPMVLRPVHSIDGHTAPSRCLKFNPRFLMMASASNDLVRFWLYTALCRFVLAVDLILSLERRSGCQIQPWLAKAKAR